MRPIVPRETYARLYKQPPIPPISCNINAKSQIDYQIYLNRQ